MRFSIIGSLQEVDADEWNALCMQTQTETAYPFTRHEFLIAMERHEAVGEKYGWFPQYLIAQDETSNKLVAALPMYLKNNSYGELVFDWAWADAYHRSGIEYYPKLVVAIPYTPATGPRILYSSVYNASYNNNELKQQMIDVATEHAKKIGVSSLHWLFTDQQETDLFSKHKDYMLRLGCQFHWANKNYHSFDDYLGHLTQSKRKKIKQERRRVKEQGIKLEVLHGNEMTEEQWDVYHQFYCDTFDRKSGYATFSKSFFKEIATTMPKNIVVVLAKKNNDYVAAAFNIRGANTLYGRHWGCSDDFHGLHFEACYYQGLEYCIDNNLGFFEPGAQGEHKISRGFLPTETWSAHWIKNSDFNTAIRRSLDYELEAMKEYFDELQQRSPFKSN